jgi:hypothetical protein
MSDQVIRCTTSAIPRNAPTLARMGQRVNRTGDTYFSLVSTNGHGERYREV